jgi:fructose-1,6-bisphosphatase
MAKKSAGDWRDRDQIQRWVASIVADMKHSEVIP